jgi:ABC-type phosphate transport system permease subunit
MVFDISVAMTWLLFLALFPMAFFWLRRAWRIFFKKNYSEVAIKRGLPPANPKKWAPIVGILNLVCGGIAVWVIIAVLLGLYPYDTWSAIAGITIWSKIIADFIIRFQAHPIQFGKKKNPVSN